MAGSREPAGASGPAETGRPPHSGNETGAPTTRAFVLHPDLGDARVRRTPQMALDEAVALASALPGIVVLGAEVVRLREPHPGLLLGSGRIEDLKTRFDALDIDLVLVDGPVSPVQQRNLEKVWGVKLLDRTGLILEIFSDRARTREGVLQVEMAALSYQRSRLVRAWTHLERQRGGFGFVGGPGETQMEADRRAIDDQLVRLKRQLAKVAKTRALHREARARVPFPVVALVGYTNAGKSTLFNRLTGAAVPAKDMLFATLDPTMRGVDLPGGPRVILSDTVGFVSDLPTELVAAFRATLEEVLSAELILHVRDIAHPESAEQAADVADVLSGLGVDPAVPVIEVWNKIDLLSPDAQAALAVRDTRTAGAVAVSARTGAGIPALVAGISAALEGERSEEEIRIPYTDGRRRAFVHAGRMVMQEHAEEGGYRIRVRWTARQKAGFAALPAGGPAGGNSSG